MRSIAEAVSAYQDLSVRRLRLVFEHATNFWTETQKLMRAEQLGRMQFFGDGPRVVNASQDDRGAQRFDRRRRARGRERSDDAKRDELHSASMFPRKRFGDEASAH